MGVNCPEPAFIGINASGDIESGISDIRIKDNVQQIQDAGKIGYHLNGIYFRYNELARKYGFVDDRTKIGLIAQDLQKVFPVAVSSLTHSDGTEYLAIEYEKLIPVIVECIKEQQREIDQYREMVDKNG